MSIYYVSALGSDEADGRSPGTAWKTIKKVNETIEGGDEVRFRGGDTFYGRLLPKSGVSPDRPTVYTSYGEGKPTLSQFKTAKKGAWEKHAENVWKLDLLDVSKFSGNVIDLTPNVGFLKISGKIYPRRCFVYEDMRLQWDFYCDEQYVFVYSEKDPSSLSDEILLACRIGCIAFTDNLRVTNLILHGSGSHGISGTVNHGYIADCEFYELGGSRLGNEYRADGTLNTTRFGNGVECWTDSSDVTVERCRFSEIYDVAITMQGHHVTKSWENMFFRNNVICSCQQAFEIWSSGSVPDTGFVNCRFENNVCLDSGYCWGYDVRPDKRVSCHLLLYHLECPITDISVCGNVFSGARLTPVFKSGGTKEIPAGYRIYDNTFLMPYGQEYSYNGDTDEETKKAFAEKFEKENRVIRVRDYPKQTF